MKRKLHSPNEGDCRSARGVSLSYALGCSFFLSSCGSLKEQEFKAGIFEYKVRHEIYPRVYVMDTTLFGIEATYSPEVKLPHVRAGLIHNLWFVDTSFGTETIYHYMIEVPWLFCTSNTLHVIPIKQEAAEPSETLFEREQELLFDPNAEATP